MPTGYTARLHDGPQTFEDFAKSCARAFGSFIGMRDSSMNAPIPADLWEPSDYHVGAQEKAEARLRELDAMDGETVQRNADEAHREAVAAFERTRTKNAETRKRYEDMLVKVEAWEPPTEDHVKFKEFMADQLRESIRFDTNYLPDVPKRPSANEWFDAEVAKAKRDVEYHRVEYAKEGERCRGAKAWATALWASLGDDIQREPAHLNKEDDSE